MEASYQVVVLAHCCGCNKSFSKKYPLHVPGYLSNLKHVDGRMIDHPQRFITEKIVFDACKCHLCFGDYRVIVLEKGFLIREDRDYNPALDMFGKTEEELMRDRKRLRLSVEWEMEQAENRDYWCEICKKPFSQSLPKLGEEMIKICEGCKKE